MSHEDLASSSLHCSRNHVELTPAFLLPTLGTSPSLSLQGGGRMTKKNAPPPAKKYKKAPDAPRRFKSSFMFFSIEKHRLIREEMAAIGDTSKPNTTEVAKIVSQAWKDLSLDEREVFEKMARRDKERYEREKRAYKGPWKVLDQKEPRKKDPNAPKRPMSAFLDFSNSKRSQVKIEHGGELSNAELSRKLARMWKDASDGEKKAYIDKEVGLRREYKIAMAKWKKDQDELEEKAKEEKKSIEGKASARISREASTEYPYADIHSPTRPQSEHQYASAQYGHLYQPQVISMSAATLPTGNIFGNDVEHAYHVQSAGGRSNQFASYHLPVASGSDLQIFDAASMPVNANMNVQSHRVRPPEHRNDNFINISPIGTMHSAHAPISFDDHGILPHHQHPPSNLFDAHHQTNAANTVYSTGTIHFQDDRTDSPLRGAQGHRQAAQPGYVSPRIRQELQENHEHSQHTRWFGGQLQRQHYQAAPRQPQAHQEDTRPSGLGIGTWHPDPASVDSNAYDYRSQWS